MAWWDRWLGRPIDLNAESSPSWGRFFGAGTDSGEVVTYDRAMQLDAVWACVNLIQNAVGTLPCIVYDEDGVTVAKDSNLYDLLHGMPNADDTSPEFWSMVALCLCLDGNFFAEKFIICEIAKQNQLDRPHFGAFLVISKPSNMSVGKQ